MFYFCFKYLANGSKEHEPKTYVYAGIFTDIRSAMLNDHFAEWVLAGVAVLDLDLTRALEEHGNNDMQQVIELIRNLIM